MSFDNMNVTQSVLLPRDSVKGDQITRRFAFFNEAGESVEVNNAAIEIGDLTLDGYEIGEPGELSDEDTLLVAFGKLEARLAVVEDLLDD